MPRTIVVAVAVALLLGSCAQPPQPIPTAVPRVTEQLVPATATPSLVPSPQPTATAMAVTATRIESAHGDAGSHAHGYGGAGRHAHADRIAQTGASHARA